RSRTSWRRSPRIPPLPRGSSSRRGRSGPPATRMPSSSTSALRSWRSAREGPRPRRRLDRHGHGGLGRARLDDLPHDRPREGGILEDVTLEVPQRKPGEAGPDAVRAQFRLTTIEPSDDTRRIMERVLAASAGSSRSPLATALTLPIAAGAEAAVPTLRDPF